MAMQQNNRTQVLLDGLAALTPEERALLKAAADSPLPGGGIIYQPLRSKAAGLRLVYLTSGLLKADVLHLLRARR